MPVNRRGTGLAELLVALVLGGVVAGLVAGTLTAQRRAERAMVRSTSARSAADDAVSVLSAAISRITGDDSLQVRGDTALEWRATVGVALACAAGADSVVLPDSGGTAWWESAPDTGDAAALLTGDGSWITAEVIGVRARTGAGACQGAQHTLRFRAVVAVVGDGSVPLVRVARRRRFMLYRGGDGAWWLGERTCSYGAPVRCDAAQPVAGPMEPPPVGLRFALDSVVSRRRISLTVAAGRTTRALVVVIDP